MSESSDQLMQSIKVWVCDKCLTASCWHGIFMCQEARDADIIEKTEEELKKLGLEHPFYWRL